MSSIAKIRGARLGACLSVVALVAIPSAAAMAQEEYEDPRVMAEEAVEAVEDMGSAPAGRLMLNTKVGVGARLTGSGASFGAQLDLGLALMKSERLGNLYVVASPEVQVGEDTLLVFPGGLQYDIPTGIRGLYIYPRMTVGYGRITSGRRDREYVVLTPALGAKLVIDQRVNIGIEPGAVPVFIGEGKDLVQYRVWAYAGINF